MINAIVLGYIKNNQQLGYLEGLRSAVCKLLTPLCKYLSPQNVQTAAFKIVTGYCKPRKLAVQEWLAFSDTQQSFLQYCTETLRSCQRSAKLTQRKPLGNARRMHEKTHKNGSCTSRQRI